MALPIGLWLLVWLAMSVAQIPAAIPVDTVKLIAVFDQADMETMSRVLQKNLASLNKERSGLTWHRTATNSGTMGQSLDKGLGTFKWKERLQMESVIVSGEWWMNQTAQDLCRLLSSHKPVAILALAKESIVFHVSLAASHFHIPIIGTRAHRGLDDSSFQVSRLSAFYWFLRSFDIEMIMIMSVDGKNHAITSYRFASVNSIVLLMTLQHFDC